MVDRIDSSVKIGVDFPEEKKFPYWIFLLGIPLIIPLIGKRKK